MKFTEVIKTDTSAMTICKMPDDLFIKEYIDEIKDKLMIRPDIQLYGKTVYQNRNVGFFSDTSIGYRYSGQLAASQPLNTLSKLLDRVNEMYTAQFNGILVNYYEDGNNYIGAHSDDESGLDPIGVVIISYGATRKFRIRDKQTKEIIKDIPTISNEIMCMSGNFQKEFTHEIPIEKRIHAPRYSFTFRKHKI